MDDQNQNPTPVVDPNAPVAPVVDQGGMPQAPVQPEPQAPVEPVVPEPVAPVMPEPQAPVEPVVPVQDPNQGGQQPGGTL